MSLWCPECDQIWSQDLSAHERPYFYSQHLCQDCQAKEDKKLNYWRDRIWAAGQEAKRQEDEALKEAIREKAQLAEQLKQERIEYGPWQCPKCRETWSQDGVVSKSIADLPFRRCSTCQANADEVRNPRREGGNPSPGETHSSQVRYHYPNRFGISPKRGR